MRDPAGPLHVLHLVTSRFVGGPQRQILRQAECLPRDRFAVRVVTFLRPDEGDALMKEAATRGVTITGLPAGGPLDFSPLAPLCDLVRSDGVDVICAHDAKSTLFGYRAARRCRVPLVAWARGWTGETLRVRLYDAVHRRLLRRADAVVAVSRAMREFLVGIGVSPGRITVIRNAFAGQAAEADGRLRRALAVGEEVPVLLSIGRLSPEKGHRYLLEAAGRLRSQGLPFALALVGEGPMRPSLERQVGRLNLGRWVHLPGFRGDVPHLLAESNLLVLPSLTEGLPNVVLEAYAARVPVVASAVGGVPEAVREGETGYLVPPRDPAALADRLAACLRDPARARAMGEAGWRSLEAFGVAEQMEAVAALFTRVVQEQRA